LAQFSFGRDRRIRKRADFVRVQKDGAAVRTPHFVLLVARSNVTGPSRLGIVTTKRIGVAVVRNRIKRLCRESFRLAPEMLPKGIDLVVIAKEGAGTLALRDVQAEWTRASAKLRAQCEKVLGARP
jgi:ribonuclease P protein component